MKSMSILEKFAGLLDYPRADFREKINECFHLLCDLNTEAATRISTFNRFAIHTPISRMEEVYTRTFDLQPVCSLYMGHHLFGEGPRRGIFMAGLKEHYGLHGFSSGMELPDHLSVMLRFLAKWEADRKEIIEACVVPCLKKMVETLHKGNNPYRDLLEGLLLFLVTVEVNEVRSHE